MYKLHYGFLKFGDFSKPFRKADDVFVEAVTNVRGVNDLFSIFLPSTSIEFKVLYNPAFSRAIDCTFYILPEITGDSGC